MRLKHVNENDTFWEKIKKIFKIKESQLLDDKPLRYTYAKDYMKKFFKK